MTRNDDHRARDGGRPHEGSRPRTLEREFTLDHPPERVWAAVTRRDLLARWLLPCEPGREGLEPGASVSFVMPPAEGDEGRIDCEVVEVEPGRRVALTWRTHRDRDPRPEGAVDTLVTFELDPLPWGGTRLRIRQVELPSAAIVCLAAARARRAPGGALPLAA